MHKKALAFSSSVSRNLNSQADQATADVSQNPYPQTPVLERSTHLGPDSQLSRNESEPDDHGATGGRPFSTLERTPNFDRR